MSRSAEAQRNTPGAYAWVIVAIVWLASITAPANMAKVTTLAPVMMEVFGIGTEAIGWIIAVFFVLGMLLAFPAAGIINRFGCRVCIIISLVFGAIGSLLGVLAPDLLLFTVSRILEGAGMGLLTVAGPAAITPWFPPDRRGLPLGLWDSFIAFAMTVCPIGYAFLVPVGGWQTVWWLTFVFDIAVLVLFLLLYRRPPRAFEGGQDKTPHPQGTLAAVFKNKTIWALVIVFFLDQFALMSVNNYITTYLTASAGTTLALAAAVGSFSGALGVISGPLAGKISDALDTRKWVLVVGCICGVIYTAAFFNVTSMALIWVVTFIGGIVGGAVPAVIFVAASEQVRPAEVPDALAFISFSQSAGMFVGATAMGSAVAAIGWSSSALFILAPCFVIATLIILFMKKVH